MENKISSLDILKEGIKKICLVSLTYEGYKRLGEPYIIGISGAGNNVTRVFQINGGSKRGKETD